MPSVSITLRISSTPVTMKARTTMSTWLRARLSGRQRNTPTNCITWPVCSLRWLLTVCRKAVLLSEWQRWRMLNVWLISATRHLSSSVTSNMCMWKDLISGVLTVGCSITLNSSQFVMLRSYLIYIRSQKTL